METPELTALRARTGVLAHGAGRFLQEFRHVIP